MIMNPRQISQRAVLHVDDDEIEPGPAGDFYKCRISGLGEYAELA